MTEKQAIQDSIAHWKRMISWAEKHHKLGVVYWKEMYDNIEEWWISSYCGLCEEYYDETNEAKSLHKCRKCPLYKIGKCCIKGYSIWRMVCISSTWGEWVKNAKVMLTALEGLLED